LKQNKTHREGNETKPIALSCPEYVGHIDGPNELKHQAEEMTATMKKSVGVASDSLTLAVESRVERTDGEYATTLLPGERAVENGQILRAAAGKINELSETRRP
tara:strand:+ start:536 stop:847 length:312 start_codon:yes stop_codon:yes gene_type:complete